MNDDKDKDKKTDWYIGRYIDSQIPNGFEQDDRYCEIAFALACAAMIGIIGFVTVLVKYM